MKKAIIMLVSTISFAANGQVSFVQEFNSIAAPQNNAKAAYTNCTTSEYDSYWSYVDMGKARMDFGAKMVAAAKPYSDIMLQKSETVNAAGVKAADDFSDLNSPEVQAKIASMSKEEQLKFAMEIQKRMQANQNVQTIQSTNKVNPALVKAQMDVTTAFNKLATVFYNAKMNHHTLDLSTACAGICGSEANISEACSKKISACENKASHTHVSAEMKNYVDYCTATMALYNKAKLDFATALGKYEGICKTLSDAEKAESVIAIYGYLAQINDFMGQIEKDGANVIIEAKNNPYTKGEY